jgi:hypothetical protein
MTKLLNVEVIVSEELVDQATELGLDMSEVLTAALQERVSAHKQKSVPTAPIYVEKPLTDAEQRIAANRLRVSKRVFANVPLGME